MRFVGLILMAMLILAGPAQGKTTLVGPHPNLPQLQRAVDRTWAPTPQGEVWVEQGECFAAGTSCVTADERMVLAPGSRRLVFFHELGHIFERRHLDDADRETFIALIGRSGAGWRDSEPGGDHWTKPSECFASAYADVALGNWFWFSDRRCVRAAARNRDEVAADIYAAAGAERRLDRILGRITDCAAKRRKAKRRCVRIRHGLTVRPPRRSPQP